MYDYLSICFTVAPCAARCFHCSAAEISVRRSHPLPLAELQRIVERYRPHAGRVYDKLGLVVFDAPLNYADLVSFNAYARRIGTSTPIMANGGRFGDHRETLAALRDQGEDMVSFSLYGTDATHDRFADRPGDFGFLKRFAEDAASLGFKLRFRIFVHRANLDEIPAVLAYVRSYGDALKKAFVDLWGFAGRGSRSDEWRPTAADRDQATFDVPATWRSEREYVTAARAGEIGAADFWPPVDMISFSWDGAEVMTRGAGGEDVKVSISVEDDAALLARLAAGREREKELTGTLPELIDRFGDESNPRLYLPGNYRQLIFRRAGLAS